jgi:hypothetical protein
MGVRSCRVTIRDTEGIEHSAEVTAESLYEAVALGLRAIRQCSWVEDIGQNFTIRVLARDTRSSTPWNSGRFINGSNNGEGVREKSRRVLGCARF